MFGYIKPAVPELKVKENELYRAVYCGLCASMGKHLSRLAPLSLNYDLVFLCLFRMALTGENYRAESFRCAAKAGMKKQRLTDNKSLEYTSCAAGLLVYYKLRDDINDNKSLLKKTAYRMLLPAAAVMRKRACVACPGLDEGIRAQIEALSELERAGCDIIDKVAHHNGEMMALVASYGLEGIQAELACQVGYHTGRWVYLIDAADDIYDDESNGCYNVLLRRFGSSGGYEENLGEVQDSLLMSCDDISRCFELMDRTALDGILRNIIYMGLPHTQTKVIEKSHKSNSQI